VFDAGEDDTSVEPAADSLLWDEFLEVRLPTAEAGDWPRSGLREDTTSVEPAAKNSLLWDEFLEVREGRPLTTEAGDWPRSGSRFFLRRGIVEERPRNGTREEEK
jgi:hypothetical protein